MDYAQQLINSIQILAESEVSDLEYNKTVRASIVEIADASIGKYKVKYQNSTFFAYALDLKTYNKGTNVYVVIPSSDFNKDPYILGTVKKLGADFIETLNPEDKMSLVGNNLIQNTDDIEIYLSSYKNEIKQVPVTIDSEALKMYKQDSEYLLIGATFTTKLPDNQKIGTGDYGLKVVCSYWDSRYKTQEDAQGETITKVYTINVKNMTGQPYNYLGGSAQYVIFPIDTDHLLSIDSVTAFVQDFPNTKSGNLQGYYNPEDGKFYEEYPYRRPYNPGTTEFNIYDLLSEQWYAWNSAQQQYLVLTDIIISNLRLEFYDALTDEEIQGIALRVTTPLGGYFYQKGTEILPRYSELGEVKPGIKLEADLRIRGKRVNPNQKVSYYWFVKNSRITNSTPGFHSYGGPGWECINDQYATSESGTKTSYLDGGYYHYLDYDKCPAYENYIKCVAVFEQDSNITVIDAVKVVYNTLKSTNNNIYIRSLMGTSFNFNTGSTKLTCGIEGKSESVLNTYSYAWTRKIDGGNEEVLENATTRILDNVNISLATYFVEYSCSVWDQDDNFLGSAAITLNNEEVKGEYKLVLHNATQVFKYDAQGVSPASPSVDATSRLDLGKFVLSFDIYDDKGQKIEMGSDAEKQRMVEIKWIWPSTNTVSPAQQTTDFESMLLPDGQTFVKEEVANPYGENGFRWVIKNQGSLSYQLQNNYDANKSNNNIQLEVIYKGYILTASTNFTFTKEGELGTNGTKYTARIVPTSTNYKKIVIIHPNGLYGIKADGSYVALDESIAQFKVELWDGGIRAVTLPSDSKVTWSTALDRQSTPSPKYLTINKDSGKIEIEVRNVDLKQNNTIKAELSVPSLLDQPIYAEYSIDLYTGNTEDPTYWIEGGYNNASYESDGTRSNYSRNGFILHNRTNNIDPSKIKWVSSWGGHLETVAVNPITHIPELESNNGTLAGKNNVIIEPPGHYMGEDVNNYIACYYTTVSSTVPVCVIPVNLYLNKYGLAAINGWDGSSIKLNTTGTNYILAPQMGAGKKEEDGSFTGITTGTAMESNSERVGLFGYYKGQRSIWLDANTGNAYFGIDNQGQIVINAQSKSISMSNAQGDGMTFTSSAATLKSHNYSTTDKTGMEISLSDPHIRYGSGKFTVNNQGQLTATDVDVKGTIRATTLYASEGGTIGGFTIGPTTLTGGNLTLNSAGSLSGPNWSIGTDGVATFRDVRIVNKKSDGSGSGSAINWTNNSGSTIFAVNSSGHLTAKSASIGDWTIANGDIYRGNFSLGASGQSISFGSGYLTSGGESHGSHTGSSSGKLTSGSGSGHASGYLGGAGGGESATWQNVTLYQAEVNDYASITYVESVNFEAKTTSKNTKSIPVVRDWTNTYRLLVQKMS